MAFLPLTKQYPNSLLLSSLFAVFFGIALFFSAPHPAFSAEEFTTQFSSTYQLSLNGPSQVTHQTTLTNRLAHIYPTSYTMLFGTTDLTALSVSQDGSLINFTKDSGDRSTTVTLSDLVPVVGQGQSTTLEVSYQTSSLFERLGRTTSINIPRLARANEAKDFVRTVLIPESLGHPTTSYPPPSSTSSQDGLIKLQYKGHANKSLSLLFGDYEAYRLTLNYQITNPTLASAETELALPPDTAYQQVILDRLDPPPLRLQTDLDGNWLAVYSLKSKETLPVQAELYLKVYSAPQLQTALSDRKALTASAPFWQVQDSSIQSLAKQLGSPLNIYDYLVEKFSYDYKRLAAAPVPRLGAVHALDNPSSTICTEFTDTFIAMTRALGIPARELVGYAFTNDHEVRPVGGVGQILHSWPEYYDQASSTWIQLDPTWGNTTGGVDYFNKLDFNHLTFVIHGLESGYPLPAGAYQQAADLSPVKVELASALPEIVHNLVEAEQPDGLLIKNLGNTAVTHPDAGYLPPFASRLVKTPAPFSPPLVFPRLWPYLLFVLIALPVLIFFRRRRSRSAS